MSLKNTVLRNISFNIKALQNKTYNCICVIILKAQQAQI